jgi:cytochrome b6-f complex iron-sulfur subunit
MNRRNFLTWVGVGSVASSLPVAIAACSSNTIESESAKTSTQTAASSGRTDGFKSVGTLSELESNAGQILNKEFSAGPVLVIRNPAEPNTLSAVNPTCTHQGCIVGWQAEQKAFVCPCHASKFDINGKVNNGPATKPLPTYEVKVEKDLVLVKQG